MINRWDKTANLLLHESGTTGIDINSKDKYEKTALHLALDAENGEMAKILVRNGADVNVTLDTEKTTPLHWSARKGAEELCEALLKQKANVDTFDDEDHSPLHLSAIHGHTEVTKILLEHNPLINATDKKSLTPLHLSAIHGNEEVAKVLLDNDVQRHLVDLDHKTPSQLAKKYGHFDIEKLIRDWTSSDK